MIKSIIPSGNFWRLFLLALISTTLCEAALNCTWSERSLLPRKQWTTAATSSSGKFVAIASANLISGSSGDVIYVSNNYGVDWSPSNSVSSVWYSLSMGGTGQNQVAGEYSTTGRIFFSNDFGINWNESASSVEAKWISLVSDRNTGQYVLAGTETSATGSIYTSSDYGVTWTERSATGAATWRGVAMNGDGMHALVGGVTTRIWHSSDYGVTWTESSSSISALWRTLVLDDSGMYAAGAVSGGGIYYSSDYGATWTLSGGAINAAAWSSLSADASGKSLLATISGGAVYESEDFGMTWELSYNVVGDWSEVTQSASGEWAVLVDDDGGGGGEGVLTGHCTEVVAPADDVQFCPTGWVDFQDQCYYSSASKMTWSSCQTHCQELGANMLCVENQEQQDLLSTEYPQDLWLGYNEAASPGTFEWAGSSCFSTYTSWETPSEPDADAGNDYALMWLAYGGAWIDTVPSFAAYCGCQAPPPRCVWTESANSPSLLWMAAAVSYDGQYALAAEASGHSTNIGYLYHSDDFGVTWTQLTSVGYTIWHSVDMSDSGQYQIACSVTYSHVKISSDYGATWVASAPSGRVSFVTVRTSSTGEYAIVSQESQLNWYSSDYGATWTASNLASGKNFIGLAMSASGQYTVAAGAASGTKIWYSSDYGATYTESSYSVTMWRECGMSSSGRHVVCGQVSGYLHYSSDYGETWSQSGGNVASGAWYGISCDATGQYWHAALSSKSIVYSGDFGRTWTIDYPAVPGIAWRPLASSGDGKLVIAPPGQSEKLKIGKCAFSFPTSQPSSAPSSQPSAQPVVYPTSVPSSQPSSQPSAQPSLQPSLSAASFSLLNQIPSYKIASGFAFAALTSVGDVIAWGKLSKSDYPTSNDTTSSTVARNVVTGSSGISAVEIVASRTAYAARTSNGGLVAWGVAAAYAGASAYETPAVGIHTLVANEAAFAGIDNNGAVIAFGGEGQGNNVVDDTQCHGYATQLSANVTSIVASAAAFAALKADGSVYAWGSTFTAGGVSSESNAELVGVIQLAATRTAFAALLHSGRVVTWGGRYSGGDLSTVSDDTTSKLQSDVVFVLGLPSVFIAFRDNYRIAVWGHPEYGGDVSSVAAELEEASIVSIAHTGSAVAALTQNGSVITWGKAGKGGDSSSVQSELVDVASIYSTQVAFAALTSSGGVVAWGEEANGGKIPDALASSVSSGVVSITSTHRAFAALKSTGEVVVWGNPYYGGSVSGNDDVSTQLSNGGVTLLCSNETAFTAIKASGGDGGRGIAVTWGHPASIPFAGIVTGADFSNVTSCA